MTDTAPDAPVENTAPIESTPAVETPQEQQQDRYDFVLDKYRKEGRSEQDAAFEQAKAYVEAQKRLGGFTGAPESYEVKLSEALAEIGVAIEADDPMVQDAIEFAKANNMNQELFSGMLELYAKAEVAKKQAEEQYIADALKTLENGENRIKALAQWAKANLPEEDYQGFLEAGVSPEAIRALERIVSKTRNAPVQPDPINVSSSSVTAEEVQKMQFAVDDYGRRRIAHDPQFRAEYERKAALVYGTEPFRKQVG